MACPGVVVSEDPTDVEGLYETVAEKLKGYLAGSSLTVYVTGLTVALGAVMQWATVNQVDLVLKHYNAKSGEYYTQRINALYCPELLDNGVIPYVR